MASFWKPEACGQTVLPDRSVLIGQKLVENAALVPSSYQDLKAHEKNANEEEEEFSVKWLSHSKTLKISSKHTSIKIPLNNLKNGGSFLSFFLPSRGMESHSQTRTGSRGSRVSTDRKEC